MKNNHLTMVAQLTGAMVFSACLSGCYGGSYYRTPSQRISPQNYHPRNSYYEIRDPRGRFIRRESSLWGTAPLHRRNNVGLPRGPLNPHRIQEKFRRDTEYLRRQHRR